MNLPRNILASTLGYLSIRLCTIIREASISSCIQNSSSYWKYTTTQK